MLLFDYLTSTSNWFGNGTISLFLRSFMTHLKVVLLIGVINRSCSWVGGFNPTRTRKFYTNPYTTRSTQLNMILLYTFVFFYISDVFPNY
ncbi:hypothetical protein Hanom_Chr11g01033711 [Helianthus anomalus]